MVRHPGPDGDYPDPFEDEDEEELVCGLENPEECESCS